MLMAARRQAAGCHRLDGEPDGLGADPASDVRHPRLDVAFKGVGERCDVGDLQHAQRHDAALLGGSSLLTLWPVLSLRFVSQSLTREGLCGRAKTLART